MSIYTTITVKCQRCNGTGQDPEQKDPGVKAKCQRCKGVGKLKRRSRPREK
jgi:DnaJ-class molecular chaperone